jgi:hypothetical protein
MAQSLSADGLLVVATLVLVGAHCLLRTGEVIRLRAGSTQFSGDGEDAVIDLGDSEGGRRQGAQEVVQVHVDQIYAIALFMMVVLSIMFCLQMVP